MKICIKNTILFMFVSLAFVSCDKMANDVEQQSSIKEIQSRIDTIPETFPRYHEDTEIVLGRRRNNPYEIHNMLHAYDLLQDYRNNFIVGNVRPEVNTLYYRVLPTDSTELAILSADTSVIYFDYPLDYDIEQWGGYYHDPSLPNSNYTWLYAVIPINHPLPHISSLEVLQECYIPNEPIGNVEHYDEIPDWRNGFAMLEYMAYLITDNIDMYDPIINDIYSQILSETAHRTIDDDTADSEVAMRSPIWDFITGVQPHGCFTVENTHMRTREGIKNAKVFIHNIIKYYCGPLDENGCYCSTTRFRTHCWYHIRFQNHHTKTNIYGGTKFLLGPVHRHVGWHSRYGFSCTLFFDDVAWRYAAVNNAVEQYFTYCHEYNILFPYDMRVWVDGLGNGQWAGSTPLFHKSHSPLIYNALTLSAIWPLLIFLDVPDMGLFVGQRDERYKTLGIYGLVFHEFAHASHYEQVGAAYWTQYVLHIINYQGYGAHADGLLHGYCGIGEMWGNFCGSHFLYKYRGHQYPYIFLTHDGDFNTSAYIPELYLDYPEGIYFYPREDWYNPGILAKIHEDSHCSITQIYHALTPDVHSLESLKSSLIHQGIDETIIHNAYETYRYWEE